MRKITALLGGALLRAAARGAGAFISGVFEPFDSLTGFLAAQIVLSIAAALTGFRAGGGALTVLLPGNYLGLNLYPYVLGGAEIRAWVLPKLLDRTGTRVGTAYNYRIERTYFCWVRRFILFHGKRHRRLDDR